MGYVLGVVLFAVGIGLSIALHEWGHMRVAQACGMRVRRYFIGFGPTLWSFRRGHTEYGFKAIPLGGFCDIAGMTADDPITEEERPQAMVYKPWWQRIAVLSGGVAMNFLVGTVVLYIVAATAGLPNPHPDLTATVAETSCVPPSQVDSKTLAECTGPGPASEAGLREGDRIVALGGSPVESFMQLRQRLQEMPGQTAVLTVERPSDASHAADGPAPQRQTETKEISVPVASVSRLDTQGQEHTVGAIGVSSKPPSDLILHYGPLQAIPATVNYAGEMLRATVTGIAKLPGQVPGVVESIFGGHRSQESPMSVVGATRVGGELAERSQWAVFLQLLAGLNFFLMLFNFVPLPPLDGGHVAMVVYEKLRDAVRRARGLQPAGPASYERIMPVTVAVSALLLGLGAVMIVADVVNPVRLF